MAWVWAEDAGAVKDLEACKLTDMPVMTGSGCKGSCGGGEGAPGKRKDKSSDLHDLFDW